MSTTARKGEQKPRRRFVLSVGSVDLSCAEGTTEWSNLAEEVLKQPPGDLDVARLARDLAAEPARRVPPWAVPAESLPFHAADCGYVHGVGPYDCTCGGVDRYLSQL